MSRTASTSQPAEGRRRPLVWIKNLVLYESIDPLVELRRIRFSTGLNIIQGEVVDSGEFFQSGHGIGKTTVCRLIRYCLGEKSFGQKHVVEEIKHCFPNGYVGAVIELDGAEWSVLRPLGNRTREYALEGVSLDGLLQAGGARRFDSFLDRLTGLIFSEVPVGEILSSGQTLQWLHVLAMCSRDQESRYDRFWNWRQARSDSGTPKLSKPKVDAGLCVRSIIGLLDPSEPRLRSKLEQLEASQARTREEIKAKRAEPSFHLTRLRSSLSTDFGVQDASDAPLDAENLLGLPQQVQSRLDALRREVDEINEQLSPLDRQIGLASVSLRELVELAAQQQAVSQATGEGNDVLLEGIERLRSVRQSIRDAEFILCRLGNVLYGQCSYVKERSERLDDEIRDRQRATLPLVSEREQMAARTDEQADRLRSTLDRLQKQLDEMNRRKNDLMERRLELNSQIRRLPSILDEIRNWAAILEGNQPNTALQRLEQEADATEADISATRQSLAQRIAAQEQRAKLFESRFDAVVRQTLSEDFRGVLEIEEDGVHFGIKRGESLSGEAYETLAVLLADLALLFESVSQYAHHPGILLHDSPREADLNLQIYIRFLDIADVYMQRSGRDGESPFQYIVTTTTPPSERLQASSVMKLRLGSGKDSLFGRQLETPTGARLGPTLFDEEGDE